jgi:hypothetical protein
LYLDLLIMCTLAQYMPWSLIFFFFLFWSFFFYFLTLLWSRFVLVIYFYVYVQESCGVSGIFYYLIDAQFKKIKFSFINLKKLKIQVWASKIKIKQIFNHFFMLTSWNNLHSQGKIIFLLSLDFFLSNLMISH